VQLSIVIYRITLVNRQVYTWGTGNFGELGVENTAFSNVPIPVNLGKRSFVVKVQCGSTYTAFIDCKLITFTFR
jgi:alpha-tubulin suppressor-like RCC1 family protein